MASIGNNTEMRNELIEQVKARKYFYRDHYQTMSSLLLVVLILIMVALAVLIFLYINRAAPDFYATSMDGKLVQLTPLATPNYSHTSLI